MPQKAQNEMNKNGNAVVTAREETALATREEHGRELSTATAAAAAQYEIQSAITVALRFKRKEDESYGALMKSCGRLTFADKARYKFPRGGTNVEGPSAHLAREAARVWGNIRYGFDIVRDDDENIHLRGWAWDMQTNTKATQDAHFRKLVYRKNGGWIKPDERDLRELVNKHGSIAERNCILKIMPADFVEDAMAAAKAAVSSGISKDVDAHRKQIIAAFASVNVTVTDLEAYLGNPLKHASPDQIADLRAVYKSIIDGNSRWSDYANDEATQEAPDLPNEVTMNDLTGEGGGQATDTAESPLARIRREAAAATDITQLTAISLSGLSDEENLQASALLDERTEEIRQSRGGRSNKAQKDLIK